MAWTRTFTAFVAFSLAASTGFQAASAADTTTDPVTTATADTGVQVAQAAHNPFKDVKPSDWAYQAVAQLAADGIINGYPDGTFKGQRPVTRYEMAVAVNRAVNTVEKRMTKGESVTPAQLAAVRKLVDEFGSELKNVTARVGKLETKTGNLETKTDVIQKEADASAAQLRLAKVGVNTWTRAGTYSSSVNGYNIAGNAITTASPFGAGTGGSTQDHNAFTNYQHPTAYSDFRIVVTGALDNRWRYGVRLDDRYTYAGSDINASTATSPSYCINAACTVNNYPSSTSVDLNYAYVGWYAPGGTYVRFGRIPQSEGAALGDVNMQFGGSNNNGLQLGYNKGPWDAWAMATVGYPASQNSTGATFDCVNNSLTGCSPQTRHGNVAFQTMVNYTLPSRTTIGGTWNDQPSLSNLGWNSNAAYCGAVATAAVAVVRPNPALCTGGAQLLTYNQAFGGRLPAGFNPANGNAPVTGGYQVASTHLSTATAYIAQKFGRRDRPQFRLSVEGSTRFGNDPFTGSTWQGNHGFQTGLAFASKGNLDNGPLSPAPGIKNSNVLEMIYSAYGLNAAGPDFGVNAPTVPFNAFYFPNFNGLHQFTFSADHWITRNFRLGLSYVHFGQNSGVNIPAGSATCPQCFVGGINGNAVFLDSWITL